MRRVGVGALVGVVVGLSVAACGGSSAGGAAPTSSSPPAPGTTATVTTTGPAPVVTTTAAGPAACANGDVLVATAELDGGLSHAGFVLTFRNTTSTTCTLTGYPGVQNVATKVNAGRTISGYLGGVRSGAMAPTVSLAPGGYASAIVEGDSAPTGGCPTQSGGTLVTPPGFTITATVAADLGDYCNGFAVHPVVPGLSGSAT